MEPIWQINSGKSFGYKNGNRLYDMNGKNTGHFKGNIAYKLNGQLIGELYSEKFIGKRNIKYADGFAYSPYPNLEVEFFENAEGVKSAEWADAEF